MARSCSLFEEDCELYESRMFSVSDRDHSRDYVFQLAYPTHELWLGRSLVRLHSTREIAGQISTRPLRSQTRCLFLICSKMDA